MSHSEAKTMFIRRGGLRWAKAYILCHLTGDHQTSGFFCSFLIILTYFFLPPDMVYSPPSPFCNEPVKIRFKLDSLENLIPAWIRRFLQENYRYDRNPITTNDLNAVFDD